MSIGQICAFLVRDRYKLVLLMTDGSEIDCSLPLLWMAPIEDRVRLRHKKRGTTYDLVGSAIVQCDRPLEDYDNVVVYRCIETGQLWIRPTGGFRGFEIDKRDVPDTRVVIDSRDWTGRQ